MVGVPVLLRRIFVIAALLCIAVPVTWLLLRHDPLEDNVDFVYRRRQQWTKPGTADGDRWFSYGDSSRNTTFKKRHGGLKPVVESGVLLLYKYRSNPAFRSVRTLLQAHRIEHDLYIMSTTRHMPKLFHTTTTAAGTDGPQLSSVGRYRFIIVLDVASFVSETSIHDLFMEYCRGFDTVLILVASRYERNAHNFYLPRQSFEDDINMFTLPSSAHVEYLRVHQADDFVYVKDGGPWAVQANNSSLVGFWPYKTTVLADAILFGGPYDSEDIKGRFQILATAHYSISSSSQQQQQTVPVALIDRSSTDGVQRVYFGMSMSLPITKLLFLEVLRIFSKERTILKIDRKRWIQVDIDDIFVAPHGYKMNESDVTTLLEAQEEFRRFVPGFQFNLGFCGSRYRVGQSAEKRGDELLVAKADEFRWFGHMSDHSKPHTMSLSALQTSMKANKKFAKANNISVESQYAVSPHHSGIYPIHGPLYSAWREVWNIAVTSTEEYPHLRPDHNRRGFIHNNIKVLPRQTCHLFTHTTRFKNFAGGREQVMAYGQRDVFNTVLYNPVTIFMTHSGNYAKDRLALVLFRSLFKFVKKWTQLELLSDTPLNLANTYFQMFPEDKNPLWTSPCNDKRHMAIWSGKATNCTQLPSLIILGPQKSGSTALHFFLKQHPQLVTNPQTPHAFEEIQFFSSDLLYNKGVDWYMSHFPVLETNHSTVIYEKSATYFTHSLAPERIRLLLPDVKLIVILSDPIKRAYSWYQHMKSHNDQTALAYNFSSVIKASKKNGASQSLLYLRSRCLLPGLYHEHLERWLQFFPEDRIYFVNGDDLVDNPTNVLLELVEYLGLTQMDYSKLLRFNPKKGFYCVLPLDKTNKKFVCLGKSKGRKYPPLLSEDIKYLDRYYSFHNRKLYQLLLQLSRRPPRWLVE